MTRSVDEAPGSFDLHLIRIAIHVFALAALLSTGCSVIDVHAHIDPGGGVLTDSAACIYDFDDRRLWYVVFLRQQGLIDLTHRHEPGLHLLLQPNGTIAYYSRCSGRGEVIDIMGREFQLSAGTVFLCDAGPGVPTITQLPIAPVRCDGHDPSDVARALDELSRRPKIAAFFPEDAAARLHARWLVSRQKH